MAYKIAEWVLLTLAYVCVTLRVYAHLFRLRKRLGWAELLLIASAIDALGLIICDTLTFRMGVLDDYRSSVELSKVRRDGLFLDRLLMHELQISFASNYFYDFGMGLPKLSMLAFYWAFFNDSHHRKIRRVLWVMTAFVVLCYLTSLFDDTFFCGLDVSVQWSQDENACSVFYAQAPFILNFTLGLVCYLIIYALPSVLLYRGTLETSTGVVLTLAAGSLPILSGVVRFICLKVGTGQENLVCKSCDPTPTLHSW